MILEIAQLQIRNGHEPEFEAAFGEAQAIIASMPGYLSHSLQRCIEHQNQYLLLVNGRRWQITKSVFGNRRNTSIGARCCTTSSTPSRLSCITRGLQDQMRQRLPE